jgi:hypothetical protein
MRPIAKTDSSSEPEARDGEFIGALWGCNGRAELSQANPSLVILEPAWPLLGAGPYCRIAVSDVALIDKTFTDTKGRTLNV